jgi:hypothetical protein
MPLDMCVCVRVCVHSRARVRAWVKDYVYMSSVDDIGTLCAKIIGAIQSVVERMLTHTWVEQDYWFDVIMVTGSSHVEVN